MGICLLKVMVIKLRLQKVHLNCYYVTRAVILRVDNGINIKITINAPGQWKRFLIMLLTPFKKEIL